MSQVIRLTLVSHAMTDAMAVGRFPADEPLNDTGRRQAETAGRPDIRCGVTQLVAPERRTRQTAHLLGLRAATEPQLADLDCGRWRGETLDRISAPALHAWLTDPAQTPHGGESIVDLNGRVAEWLQSQAGMPRRTVAVTQEAVIRAAILAALDGPPESFWRIDIAPASCTVMHYRGHHWTLRL